MNRFEIDFNFNSVYKLSMLRYFIISLYHSSSYASFYMSYSLYQIEFILLHKGY